MENIFYRKNLICTVAKEQSFSKAAQKLFIAQPSLSLMVKSVLEKDFYMFLALITMLLLNILVMKSFILKHILEMFLQMPVQFIILNLLQFMQTNFIFQIQIQKARVREKACRDRGKYASCQRYPHGA